MRNTLIHFSIAALMMSMPFDCLRAQDAAEEEERTDNKSLLEDAAREMKVAADHLSKKTTNKPTQKAQDNAISKLDSLIAELEKERQQLGGGVGANPVRPANESTVRQGPGGMGDLHSTQMKADRWGELPPHERDRILQSLTEGFPPHYQAVLEAYYKRLAVEKKADASDAEDTAPPKATSKPEAAKGAADKTEKPAAAPAAMKMATPVKKNGK